MKTYVKNGYVYATDEAGNDIACAKITDCKTVMDLQRRVENSVIGSEEQKYNMVLAAIKAKSIFLPA